MWPTIRSAQHRLVDPSVIVPEGVPAETREDHLFRALAIGVEQSGQQRRLVRRFETRRANGAQDDRGSPE